MAAAQKEAQAAAERKAKHLEDPETLRSKRVGKSASIKRKSKLQPDIQIICHDDTDGETESLNCSNLLGTDYEVAQ